MDEAGDICLLHIGKTGGSYLRSILRHNRKHWSSPLQLLRHSATLTNTLDTFGEDRRLAFTFRHPTERLEAEDEAKRSAAHFAFNAIDHLQSNLAHHLTSPEALHMSKGQIIACADLHDLDAVLPDFLARLGLPRFDMPKHPKHHAAPAPLPTLSPKAEAALRRYWDLEYRIYDAAREIANDLGLGRPPNGSDQTQGQAGQAG